MPPGFQDPDCTVFVSNVGEKVTEEHLWELFLQAGPLRNVHIPTDKATGRNKSFAFITFSDPCSVLYACELLNTLRLFKKPIYCKPTKDGKHAKQTSEITQSQTKPENSSDTYGNASPNSPVDYVPHDRNNDRKGYRDRGREREREDYNKPFNARNEEGNSNGYHSRSPNRQNSSGPPWRSNEIDSTRYNPSQTDQANYRDSRDRYNEQRVDNQRYAGSSSPSSNNQSPLFMQAINQSIHQIRRQTSHDPHQNNSPHYGPMRQNVIPRHRTNRRNRSQPY